MTADDFKCLVREGILHLNQIHAGDFVEVYTIDGKLLRQQHANSNAMRIQLSGRGLYIVRIQGKAKKVVY
jgi:hypothetical protein